MVIFTVSLMMIIIITIIIVEYCYRFVVYALFIIDNYNNNKKNIGNINAKNKNNCIFYKCRN